MLSKVKDWFMADKKRAIIIGVVAIIGLVVFRVIKRRATYKKLSRRA